VGQGHAMNKILVLLRREALRLTPPVAAEDLASLSNAMTELEHEVGRSAPRPGVFNRHVEVAIGAFRRTAIGARSPRPSALAGCAGREAAAKRRAPLSPMTGPVLACPSADGR